MPVAPVFQRLSTSKLCPRVQSFKPFRKPFGNSHGQSSVLVSDTMKGSNRECVRTSCSYAEAYKQIKENRIAKAAEKKARQEAEQRQAAGERPEEGLMSSSELVCQRGDVVTLRWDAVTVSTGATVDIRKTHFSLLTERGEPIVELQVGNDVGYEPKRGLKLAFSEVARGLKAGDVTTVLSRPTGGGWFRAYELFSNQGVLLSQLTQDERSSSWAQDETLFQVEVVKVTPARGREASRLGRKR